MYWKQLLGRLQFDNKRVLNEKIQPPFSDWTSLVQDTNRFLALEANLPQAQFDCHRLFIDAFKKARAKDTMNLECSTDYGIRRSINLK